MTTGIALKLGGAIENPIFGKLRDIEGDNEGTVFLWDADFLGASGDVPITGTMTNMVADRAAAISGLTADQCAYEIECNGITAGQSGAYLAVERTAKGGIHVASTQAGSQDTNPANWLIRPQGAFADWLLGNTDAGADYAVLNLLWVRLTRKNGVSSAPQAVCALTSWSSSTANYLLYAGGPVSQPAQYPKSTYNTSDAGNVGTPGLLALASKQWTGTKPVNWSVSGTKVGCFFFNAGAYAAWRGNNVDLAASMILYRQQTVLVDLADVDGDSITDKVNSILAEQQQMIERDFAEGGRFADDAWTDPAVLKP
jgi:hypothetical protein